MGGSHRFNTCIGKQIDNYSQARGYLPLRCHPTRRICLNSSMKQPLPSGVSLKDCLLKGPSALADLYTVTLGMREHKVAFTKDIQCAT